MDSYCVVDSQSTSSIVESCLVVQSWLQLNRCILIKNTRWLLSLWRIEWEHVSADSTGLQHHSTLTAARAEWNSTLQKQGWHRHNALQLLGYLELGFEVSMGKRYQVCGIKLKVLHTVICITSPLCIFFRVTVSFAVAQTYSRHINLLTFSVQRREAVSVL